MVNGTIDLAQKLIEVGASLDLQDSSGRYFWFMYFNKISRYLSMFLNLSTALQLAIVNGYSDLATYLVESGANLDLQDSNGRYVFKIQISFSIH